MRVLRRFFLGCVVGLLPTAAAAREPGDTSDPDGVPTEPAAGPGEATTAEPPAEPPADAEDATRPGPVVAVTQSAQAQLEEAARRYQFGERDAARGMFAALVIDETAPANVRQEARVYLGELLYVAGDREEARRFFEQVLQQDPTYEVDAFRHPPEVVGFFNYVRAYHTAPPDPGPDPLPPAPTLVPPSPVSAMMGHGVYHLRYGKPGRGVLYLGLQGGFLAADAVLWAGLLTDRSYREGDEAERQRLNRNRTLTGVMAAGYWGTWLVSAVDANVHWRRVEGPARARAAAGLGLPPVQVRGTF
jgi:tetratricopeptide (TPR) repeat protein